MKYLFTLPIKSGTFLLLFLLLAFKVHGQTKTNLDLFFQLADSAANSLVQNLGDKKNIQIDFVLGKDYQVFQNSILSHFTGKKIENDSRKTEIQFALTEVKVSYGEHERKELFGSFFVKRNLRFSGNYSIISVTNSVKNFSYSMHDELLYEEIAEVENPSFPFTQSKIPVEPFFSSLFEPVLALSSAAAAVYIFFTARSK